MLQADLQMLGQQMQAQFVAAMACAVRSSYPLSHTVESANPVLPLLLYLAEGGSY